MTKAHRGSHAHKPEPQLTAHEIMAHADAENMIGLVRDLTTYMPPPYKETLLRDGCLFIKLGKYQIQITISGKFEMPVEGYGRVNW